MAEAIYANPRHATLWGAGFVCSVLATLPPDDPWRNLSAAFYAENGETFQTETANTPAPSITGARTQGRVFGTRMDAVDLIIPEANDWSLDLGLAALQDDPHPWAAAIIGFCAHGFEEALPPLMAMLNETIAARKISMHPTDSPNMQAIGHQAVSRVIHRRRTYLGVADPFIAATGFAWITRATLWDRDPDRVLEEMAAEQREHAIDPDDYRRFSFH